ncbi:MAG TPA: hypothetical protein VLA54_07585, partial [Acidimicrobiia bacterium]|nr:hypothetical protein [Acidimicrobiia bacterium]
IGMTSLALLGACAGAVSDKHTIVEPMTLGEADDDGIAPVMLTERAMQRLDIQTVAVEQSEEWLVVPSDAVFVDETGTFWLYTNPEPLVYLRHQIGVSHDDGESAFLTDGPDPGTPVVTVGVPELYGAETGVGH